MDIRRRTSLVHCVKDNGRQRRDSVVSLGDAKSQKLLLDGPRPSISGGSFIARRVSLRPPANMYTEEPVTRQRIPSFLSEGNISTAESEPMSPLALEKGFNVADMRIGSFGNLSFHLSQCTCGRIVRVPCDREGGVASRSRKSSYMSSRSGSPFTLHPVPSGSSDDVTQSIRQKVHEAINFMKGDTVDHAMILNYCKQLDDMADSDSIDVVMSRGSVISCLLDVVSRFPDRDDVKRQACRTLLRQIQSSDASLAYISDHDGMAVLFDALNRNPDDREIQTVVLDIFGYISTADELREKLTSSGHPSLFLRVMNRHENDATIVKQCIIILGSLAMSEVTARSLMMVGGVHCIVSTMKKYQHDAEVVRHSCTTLGMFASHEDTCVDVAETGATSVVIAAMTSHFDDEKLQEAACWALACFTKLEPICENLSKENALSCLMKTMNNFPGSNSIRLYGCWALSNMVAIEKCLPLEDARSALAIMTDCTRRFYDDVELQEQLCFSVSQFITNCVDIHTDMVKSGGLQQILTSMKLNEENDDVQYNGCRIIGNLAVSKKIRKRVEDLGASEAVIRAMLNLDRHDAIQLTGCMALTNLSADESENKIRIIHHGGVQALLAALRGFPDDENVQLSALKTICNLLESDIACWSLVEDGGFRSVISAMKHQAEFQDLASFGCLSLSLIPRKGIDIEVLKEVEEALVAVQRSRSQDSDFIHYVMSFYENVLAEGNGCKALFTSSSFNRVMDGMKQFRRCKEIQITGCKIMAQLALDGQHKFFNRDSVKQLMDTMDSMLTDHSVQVLCCACVSYLSDKEHLQQLLSDKGAVAMLVRSMRENPNEVPLQMVAVMALENFCRNGIPTHFGEDIASAVAMAMKLNENETELQLSGCNILALIAKSNVNGEKLEIHKYLVKPLVAVLRRHNVRNDVKRTAAAALGDVNKRLDAKTSAKLRTKLPDLEAELRALVFPEK